MFLNDFRGVVMLLAAHRVDEEGDPSWSSERLAQYQQDAKRFLDVTRRMADLDWTHEEWRFLGRRKASAVPAAAGCRAECEREFKDAPLPTDTKQQTAKQEDGTDRYNSERLERLARKNNVPILGIRAGHSGRREAAPKRMDADDFRRLNAELRLCVGARAVLATNEWVEAALVNVAAGYVRGCMLSRGFGSNSAEPTRNAPVALIVEVDEVNLDGPHREGRTFYSKPGRQNWVPIYRSAPVTASTGSDITRQQFRLALAGALARWKAQGMTLRQARVCMRRAVAGAAGVGYVPVTRVKFVEHHVFEEDLPA